MLTVCGIEQQLPRTSALARLILIRSRRVSQGYRKNASGMHIIEKEVILKDTQWLSLTSAISASSKTFIRRINHSANDKDGTGS